MKYRGSLDTQEVTQETLFFSRRKFLKTGTGLFTATTIPSNSQGLNKKAETAILHIPIQETGALPANRNNAYHLPSMVSQELTPRTTAAAHNNFYEFLPNRGGPVWKYVGNFKVEPWRLEIGGLCRNPSTIELNDLFKFEHEERIYHFRCVERWAMNVPWSGFPLRALIKKADPLNHAKYIRFTSAFKPKEMPGTQKAAYYPWPYTEALRLDEAMNELAMLVTGVYGKPLPIQHGAPVRLIVPWKYGYKNPKSLVRIDFLDTQPETFWMIQKHEYGFLSNVNPNIPHPRWSQQRSRWLGQEHAWFETPIFNGYEKYVKHLYPDEPREPQKALKPGQIAR